MQWIIEWQVWTQWLTWKIHRDSLEPRFLNLKKKSNISNIYMTNYALVPSPSRNVQIKPAMNGMTENISCSLTLFPAGYIQQPGINYSMQHIGLICVIGVTSPFYMNEYYINCSQYACICRMKTVVIKTPIWLVMRASIIVCWKSCAIREFINHVHDYSFSCLIMVAHWPVVSNRLDITYVG